MKYFEYNKLFIIESFSSDEISKGYNIPNINLIKCLNSLKSQPQLKFFNYELIKINNGISQFTSTIKQICEECNKGTYPIIHFLGHGSKGGGIHFWDNSINDYSMLDWKKLYASLAKVNKACHNNLFFTTAACYGFDSYSVLFAEDIPNIPFVGIVAINPNDSFYVDDANIVFSAFYKSLLETESVNNAINEVKSLENKLLGKMPSIAFTDVTFKNSYLEAHGNSYTRENIKNLVENAAREKNWSSEIKAKVLSDFMNNINEYKQKDYIRIRNTKFLFDDPLVDQDRFNLPDSINEL